MAVTIALIAWLQTAHTELVMDHEWPALATTLPQSNNAMSLHRNDKRQETHTCYKCHTVGHIAPNCYHRREKSDTSNNSIHKANPKALDGESVQREWKKIASSKY
jgi:hypothetical protein